MESSAAYKSQAVLRQHSLHNAKPHVTSRCAQLEGQRAFWVAPVKLSLLTILGKLCFSFVPKRGSSDFFVGDPIIEVDCYSHMQISVFLGDELLVVTLQRNQILLFLVTNQDVLIEVKQII